MILVNLCAALIARFMQRGAGCVYFSLPRWCWLSRWSWRWWWRWWLWLPWWYWRWWWWWWWWGWCGFNGSFYVERERQVFMCLCLCHCWWSKMMMMSMLLMMMVVKLVVDDTGGADGDFEWGWSLLMQREIAASVYLPLPSPPTVIVSYSIWRTRKNKCSTLLNIKTVICFRMFTSWTCFVSGCVKMVTVGKINGWKA